MSAGPHLNPYRIESKIDSGGMATVYGAQARHQLQVFLDTFTDPDPELEWMVEEGRAEPERLGG